MVTVTVNTTLLKTVVEVGEAICDTPRSAAAAIVVTRAEELFPGDGSAAVELIFTVLVLAPSVRGLMVTVALTVLLLVISPKEKVTIPLFST